MFKNLPEELNKKIMNYFSHGFKCVFCKVNFYEGCCDPHGSEHCCRDCTSHLMYERGYMGFFENKIFIRGS